MRRTSWTTLAATVVAALALAAPAHAADGDLDPSFGGDGFADLGRESGGVWVGRQSDGKVVVASAQVRFDTGGSYVVRLTTTGELDTSFGNGGYVALDFSANAIAVQPDDKIVVAGDRQRTSPLDAVVARLNPEGTPDSTFGGDGEVEFDYPGEEPSTATAVVVQPNRRIVVTGQGLRGDSDFHAARLRIDGKLDTSFSGDGHVTEDLGGRDVASALVLQGSRIVLVGTTNLDPDPIVGRRFALLALTSSGARDPAFGPSGSGTFLGATDQVSWSTGAIRTQDGGILAVGSPNSEAQAELSPVLKLTASGTADPSFSGDGHHMIDLGPGAEGAIAPVTTADGNYAIAGSFGDQLAIAKLSPSGEAVTSFGDGGRRTYSTGLATSLALQPNGKLLLGFTDERAPRVARIQDAGSTPSGPAPPLLELTGGSAVEGQILPFTATLSRPSDQPVTFRYTTGEGTAANNRDFGARSGTATIPAGQTSVVIGIPTNSDRQFENEEMFRVELSNATNARLGEYVAFGTILNDLRSGRCQNIVTGRKGTDILTGSSGGDLIIGRQDIDFLYGLAGADCIRGERGGDLIDGGSGNDVIDGGSGNDQMRGGDGNDRIYGRRGRNRYNGGDGNDRIYARNGVAEVVECGAGRDVVRADSTDRFRRCEIVTR